MNAHPSIPVPAPLRAGLAKAICLTTLALIFVGGVVTSNNAGLAVPDWPTSFGYQMWAMPFALWHGGILYEHSHRVLASVLGLMVMALAVWLMAVERRRPLRILGLSALAIVIAQGILGGVGVLLSLPVAISVTHGVLAQLFFCLTIVIAYLHSREYHDRLRAPAAAATDPRVARGVAVVALLIGAQLVLAAYMRHDLKFQGGVAIPDFPTTAGRWLPWGDARAVDWVNAWREAAVREHAAPFNIYDPVRQGQILIHLAHRAMALVIIAALVILTRRARRCCPAGGPVRQALLGLNVLLVAQVALGILTVWSNRGPLITSLHVVVGAAMLGLTTLLALRVWPPWRLPQPSAILTSPAPESLPA